MLPSLLRLCSRRALLQTQQRPFTLSTSRNRRAGLGEAFKKAADIVPFKKTAKLLVAVEVVSCLALFAGYVKVNRDRDFRFYLATHPELHVVLEAYYKLGETMDACKLIYISEGACLFNNFLSACPIRKNDFLAWRAEGRIR